MQSICGSQQYFAGNKTRKILLVFLARLGPLVAVPAPDVVGSFAFFLCPQEGTGEPLPRRLIPGAGV